MALARFPKTFRCGISGLMVSDLELQLTSTAGDTAFPAAVQFWLNMIGVKSTGGHPARDQPGEPGRQDQAAGVGLRGWL
jgi:hypothetical protein